MAEFIIKAVRLQEFEVKVEAADEAEALASVDDWIIDDFEPFATHSEWQLEAWED